MDDESLLLHSQVPPNFLILSQLDAVHTTTYQILKNHSLLSSHLRLGLHSAPFTWEFPINIQYKIDFP